MPRAKIEGRDQQYDQRDSGNRETKHRAYTCPLGAPIEDTECDTIEMNPEDHRRLMLGANPKRAWRSLSFWLCGESREQTGQHVARRAKLLQGRAVTRPRAASAW
jgi:hypothetical protein